MNNPFGVRFDITFFQEISKSFRNGFLGEKPVFVYIQGISRAPDSPRALRKNTCNAFEVRFDITFFKKAQSLTGMDL